MFVLLKRCRPLYFYLILEIVNIIISHLYLDSNLVWRSLTIFNVTAIMFTSILFYLLCKHSYCRSANVLVITMSIISVFGHIFAYSNRKHFFINNEGNVDFKR